MTELLDLDDGVRTDDEWIELADGKRLFAPSPGSPDSRGAPGRWGCSGSPGAASTRSTSFAAHRPAALKAIVTLCSTDDRYATDVHSWAGASWGRTRCRGRRRCSGSTRSRPTRSTSAPAGGPSGFAASRRRLVLHPAPGGRTAPLVAVRLCDVAPDGTSLLVSRGLLNLTHRADHESIEAVPPASG